MVLKAYCTHCGRQVYLDEDKTPVCPVCSNPLIDSTLVDEQAKDDSGA